MPTPTTLPCSLDRSASPRWLAMLASSACMLAWTSHATLSLSATESELVVADPPLCVEPHTDGGTTASDVVLTFAPEVPQPKIVETEIVRPELHTVRTSTLPVTELSVNIMLPEGNLPFDVAAQRAATTQAEGDSRLFGRWAMTEHNWSATCLCHRPLYFEDVNLERYGYSHSHLFQPLISATRFFATIPALPYKMVLQRPRQCIYTLGHYRPGSCAPWHWHRLPLHAGAGLVEAGVVVGLVFLIP